MPPYPSVFIEDSTVDETARGDTYARLSNTDQASEFFVGFGVVGTHDDAVSYGYPFSDDASKADNAVFDDGSFSDPTTVGDQRSCDRRSIDDGGGQEASPRVNGFVGGKEVKRRVWRRQ